MQLSVVKPRSSKASDIEMEIVDVTPGIAEAWLGKNTNNRRSSKATVDAYTRDMLAGRWNVSGDPIRFDVDANLIDGQHRLLACIAADVPFKTLVIYGLPREVQDTIDTNRPRSAANVLQMRGVANAVNTSSACRFLIDIANGVESLSGGSRGRKTHSEIIHVVKKHPLLAASVTQCIGTIGASNQALIVVHYLASHYLGVPDTAAAFVNVFKSGKPDYDGCAAHALRERVLRHAGESTRMPPAVRAISTVTAWNHFARRTPISKFVVPKTGALRIEGLDRTKLLKSLK